METEKNKMLILIILEKMVETEHIPFGQTKNKIKNIITSENVPMFGKHRGEGMMLWRYQK